MGVPSHTGTWRVDVGFGVLEKREAVFTAFRNWERYNPRSAVIWAKELIYFSVYLLIHPFIYLFIHLSNHLSIHHPYTHLFIHPPAH